MKINFSKVKYIFFCVATLTVVSLSVYLFLFDDKNNNYDFLNISASAQQMDIENVVSATSISAQTENSQTETVAQASATGKIKGKITEKSISPKSSNLSYGNLYVKNNTDLTPDLKGLFESKLGFSIEENGEPQVLILHTHATESYMLNGNDYYTDSDSPRNTNNSYNMTAIGEIVANRLNTAGIGTIQDKTKHDYPSYNESYSRAAKTICSYQNQYKSIKVIIDIHRDSIVDDSGTKTKLTKTINGKKAAQIMIVMGSQSGSVKNFPNYEENLKLAFKLQEKIESTYKGLARGLYLMPRNYNESLSTGSMLIEIGTDANTLEEAKYSAELLSDCLVTLLKEL